MIVSKFKQVRTGCACPECDEGRILLSKPPKLWYDPNYVPILKWYCSKCDFEIKMCNGKVMHYSGTVLICKEKFLKMYYSCDSLDKSALPTLQETFKEINQLTTWSRTGFYLSNILMNKVLICP